jgi:hypothetical protein
MILIFLVFLKKFNYMNVKGIFVTFKESFIKNKLCDINDLL